MQIGILKSEKIKNKLDLLIPPLYSKTRLQKSDYCIPLKYVWFRRKKQQLITFIRKIWKK